MVSLSGDCRLHLLGFASSTQPTSFLVKIAGWIESAENFPIAGLLGFASSTQPTSFHVKIVGWVESAENFPFAGRLFLPKNRVEMQKSITRNPTSGSFNETG
jgi:hypothetical protein